jgi:hypothetical protein
MKDNQSYSIACNNARQGSMQIGESELARLPENKP